MHDSSQPTKPGTIVRWRRAGWLAGWLALGGRGERGKSSLLSNPLNTDCLALLWLMHLARPWTGGAVI